MPEAIVIDVRNEPCSRRRELVFGTAASLAPGESFDFVNNHDPQPLRHVLEAERPGLFSWEYVERGPEAWRIRIGRNAV